MKEGFVIRASDGFVRIIEEPDMVPGVSARMADAEINTSYFGPQSLREPETLGMGLISWKLDSKAYSLVKKRMIASPFRGFT